METRITSDAAVLEISDITKVDRVPLEWEPLTAGWRVPRGWEVHNAPRPLFGTVTWRGPFLTGVFYAAISPDDPDRDAWIANNNRDGAVIVRHVGLSILREIGREYLCRNERYRQMIESGRLEPVTLDSMFVSRGHQLLADDEVSLHGDGSWTFAGLEGSGAS